MRNVHFRFLSAAQKRRLHKLSNIKGNNNKQKDSSGTIRMIMVMTKNNYDNDDDDYLQLNKMYGEHENKIALLISPANFPRKKKLHAQEHPPRSPSELKKLLFQYCYHSKDKECNRFRIS